MRSASVFKLRSAFSRRRGRCLARFRRYPWVAQRCLDDRRRGGVGCSTYGLRRRQDCGTERQCCAQRFGRVLRAHRDDDDLASTVSLEAQRLLDGVLVDVVELAGAAAVEAAEISNHAAGIVVGKVGTATCSPEELKASFARTRA